MKKVLLLLICCVVTSCSHDDKQEYVTQKGLPNKVRISIETNYLNYNLQIIDCLAQETIFNQDSMFNTVIERNFINGERYIFSFYPLDQVSNPYVKISIVNNTTNQVLEEYNYQGCIIKYSNSFIIR